MTDNTKEDGSAIGCLMVVIVAVIIFIIFMGLPAMDATKAQGEMLR